MDNRYGAYAVRVLRKSFVFPLSRLHTLRYGSDGSSSQTVRLPSERGARPASGPLKYSTCLLYARLLTYSQQVWPAFWTKGPNWPENGEIDILEGVNGQIVNQYALHTSDGCLHTTPPNQLGVSAGNVNSDDSGSGSGNVGSGGSAGSGDGGAVDALDCSSSAGCTVAETKPASFGADFAQAGGGVFAAQFDVTGILYVNSKHSIQSLFENTYSCTFTLSHSSCLLQHLVLPARFYP